MRVHTASGAHERRPPSRALLRAAPLLDGAVLASVGSASGEPGEVVPLPGNPKGSHHDAAAHTGGSEPPPPAANVGVFLWGVGGVVLLLGVSVWRLSFPAAEAFDHELGTLHLGFAVAWCVFMLYSEGWRGFHKQFSPRVVQRAWGLPATPHLVALAPLVCMGFIHATRKRRIVTWALTVGIVAIVIVVRQLEQPWKGLVDLGVVLGLASGTASIVYFAVRALGGRLPGVPPDWPVA